MFFVHFWCCKMQYFQSFLGASSPGPPPRPCPGPTGGLKAPPRPPAARGNDLTVIAYRASGTVIPTQTYPSPSTNLYTQSKTLQYPTNFSSTFRAVGQGSNQAKFETGGPVVVMMVNSACYPFSSSRETE